MDVPTQSDSGDPRDDLAALIRGELSEDQEARLFEALDADPELRRELLELSEADAMLETFAASAQRRGDDTRDVSADLTEHPKGRPDRRLGRRGFGFIAGVAGLAAAIVLGILLGTTITDPNNSNRDEPDPIRLEAVGDQPASATAVLSDKDETTRLTIDVETLPPAPPGHYYEAWMLSDTEGEPISMGVVADTGGEWTVPANIPSEYSIIDVSIEPLSGGPDHSGISVMRSTQA